jgi:tetratricopeptide (TPR) repeat protein
MNSPSSSLESQGRILTNKDVFPLDFATVSPLCISDQLSMIIGEKKAILSDHLREIVDNNRSLDRNAPLVGKLLDSQVEYFIKDLSIDPNNTHLLVNLGNAYLGRGNIDEAIRYFKHALNEDGSFLLAQLNLAKAFMLQNKFQEALQLYLNANEKHPNNTKVLMNLAHAYVRQQQLEKAEQVIEQILSLEKDNFVAYYNRGIIKLIRGKIDVAIAEFRRSVAVNTRFVEGYNALGICYIVKANYSKAIKYLIIAHTLGKSQPSITITLANAYQLAKDYDRSINLLEALITDYPRNYEARDRLAFAFFQLGKYDRALGHLYYLTNNSHVMELDDNTFASILNNVGVVYEKTNKPSDAEAMYVKALSAATRPDPQIYFNLAKLYINLDKGKKAEELIEAYAKIAPGDDSPTLLLGIYNFFQGKYDTAKDIFLRIPESSPQFKRALSFLGCIYAEVFQDYDQAIEVTTKGLKRYPTDQGFTNDLAYDYLEKGMIAEATAVLDRLDWDKVTFVPYATKGLLRISEGNIDEGVSLYTKAANLAPTQELKSLVRQKQRIEMAKYWASKGNEREAIRQLNFAKSIQLKSTIYENQIGTLSRRLGGSTTIE